MHELQSKQQQIERKKQQEQYRDELKHLTELKKANELWDQDNHNYERSILKNKWELQSQLHKRMKEEEKNVKSTLSQDYQTQMQLSSKNKLTEAEIKRMNEQQTIEYNKRMMEMERQQQKNKRLNYTRDRNEDLKLKMQKNNYDSIIAQKDTEEAKRLMSEYTKNELDREEAYRKKYNTINHDMQQKCSKYSENVLRSNLQRQVEEESKRKEEVTRYNQKIESDYLDQLSLRKTQQNHANLTNQKQLREKNHKSTLNSHLFTLESQQIKDKAMEIQSNENQYKNEMKKQQLLYREMLGNQVDFKNRMRMQGNMTSVEKQLNKVDLKAYQNNDKNVYAFVPGINHSTISTKTGFHVKKPVQKSGEEFEKERIRRLEAMGYKRGFKGNQNILQHRNSSRHKQNRSISLMPDKTSNDGLDVNKTFDYSNNLSETQNRRISETPNKRNNHFGNGSPYREHLGNGLSNSAFKRAGYNSLDRSINNPIC